MCIFADRPAVILPLYMYAKYLSHITKIYTAYYMIVYINDTINLIKIEYTNNCDNMTENRNDTNKRIYMYINLRYTHLHICACLYIYG